MQSAAVLSGLAREQLGERAAQPDVACIGVETFVPMLLDLVRRQRHLEMASGTSMQHVPFREVSQLFTSVGAGDVGWSFASIPSSQGAYEAGKLRYIAVAAARRIPQMPEVPTVAEAGGPAGLEVNTFVVLVARRCARGSTPTSRRVSTPSRSTLSWSAPEIERQAQARSAIYAEPVKRKNISLD